MKNDGYSASPAYDEDAGPDYDEDAGPDYADEEYDPSEEDKMNRVMTADELRAAEPGISDEDIKIEQEEQQKDLDEQKARTTKIEAMLAESRGGSKGIQPTASPVEVPPPAPSGGAAMSEKSSQLSESKRMESSADMGDMVNNTTNNNNQGSVGAGAKGKPADVFDSTLNEALAT